MNCEKKREKKEWYWLTYWTYLTKEGFYYNVSCGYFLDIDKGIDATGTEYLNYIGKL